MLNKLRISARTYNEIQELESGEKVPGNVEVTVEVLHYDQSEGTADWSEVLKVCHSPDETRALAVRFEQIIAELRRAAKQAERQRDTCRIMADGQTEHLTSTWDNF